MSEDVRMNILVLGTHPHADQKSMTLYTRWLKEACAKEFRVSVFTPLPLFVNGLTKGLPFAKWLMYLDQYLVTALILFVKQARYDFVVSADHSNVIGLMLVSRKKAVSMVHDTIAMRQALGLIPKYPRAGATGRTLQRLIIGGLQRCRFLFGNPPPVPNELKSLGVDTPVVVIGCPFDARRFGPLEGIFTPEGLPQGARYFLNVGSDLLRKRKAELVQMWAHVEALSDNHWLVLAGHTEETTRELIATLGLKRVIVLNRVSEAELGYLYRDCFAELVSSESEGFCIPVLEGLAFSKTVFTPADIGFFTEVFGAAVRPVLSFDRAGAEAILAEASVCHEGYDEARRDLLARYGADNFNAVVCATLNAYGAGK